MPGLGPSLNEEEIILDSPQAQKPYSLSLYDDSSHPIPPPSPLPFLNNFSRFIPSPFLPHLVHPKRKATGINFPLAKANQEDSIYPQI